MKTSYLITSCLTAVLLTGCIDNIAGIDNSKPDQYIKNSSGGWALHCRTGGPLGVSADRFWNYNNLPHGTVDYVCKEGKAYLPGRTPNCDMQDGFCPPDKDTKKCYSLDTSYYYAKSCKEGDRLEGYWQGNNWLNRVRTENGVKYIEGKWFGL